MKNKKGFNQISISIAIIILSLFIGGGIFGFNKYKSYQIQKNEKEKITQEQQKSEIEKLSQEVETLKNKPAQTIIQNKVSDNGSKNDLINLIEQWKPRIAKVVCRFDERDFSSYYGWDDVRKSGSGYLISMEYRNDETGKLDESVYAIATNGHVVMIPPLKNISYYELRLGYDYSEADATSCEISFDGHPTVYKTVFIKDGEILTTPFGLGYIESYQDYIEDPNGVDFALVKIVNPDDYIKKNIGSLTSCNEVRLGEKIIILGFPEIGAESGITVAEGIISGEEENYYVTSAKIDSGNSGGVAISSDRNCFIGTPTATIIGQAESFGRILKTTEILKNKKIIK